MGKENYTFFSSNLHHLFGCMFPFQILFSRSVHNANEFVCETDVNVNNS